MKKILLSLIALSSVAFCNENLPKESHTYVTLGIYAPLPIPMVGIGRRILIDNQGLDVSFDIGTVIVGTFLNAHCKYISYFKNNYMAIGLKGTFGVVSYDKRTTTGLSFAPEATFGKDNESTFHQVNLSLPHVAVNERISFIPVISYQYGIKF